MERTNRAFFHGVCIFDTPIVEGLFQVNIFQYDIDFVDGAMIGKIARGSVAKHSRTVKLIRYKRRSCYLCENNVLFKAHQGP